MSHDPSGIRRKNKYVAMKDDEDEEQRGDRGEEVSHWTDDGGEPFVPALTRIPRDGEEHDPSGIRLQYKHSEEDGGERDTGGGRFLEPTLIRLPPAKEHKREDITFSNADDDNKKPAATADLSRVSDHDVSPRTVVRALSEPVNRVQFPQADSPTGRQNYSMYKMEMKASKNSHNTAPASAFDAAPWGDPWPSGGITMLPGAQGASSESARIKKDTMGQAATGNQPMLRPHFVSSPAMEPPLPGRAQLKSPPVLSPSTNVAAAVPPPPPTATGPNNNHEDFMNVKALVRAWDKMNIEMKPAPTDNRVPFGPEFKDQARGFNPIEKERIEMKLVPTDNRVPFGPKFKDQARGFNPIEEERVENVDSHESSTGGPTLRHQIREEDSEEEINTEAGDASISDSGHGAISNGTTRLVEAELVIPAEAEVIEVMPLRKACLVVFALLLITGAILGGFLGSRSDLRDPDGIPKVKNAGCDNATALELDGAAIVVQLSSNKSFPVDDSLLQGCGAVPRPTDEHIGIWYTFETNVTRGVRISTCTDSINDDFDRNILVFSGSCGQLDCLPKDNNNDDGGPLQGCGREKAVSFQALRSPSAYHVLVYGRKVSSSTGGNFTLQATNRHVKPTNYACEGATTLESDGEWHNSSALDADYSVWFLFESREGEITISTCSPANLFGHNIDVYSGSCSSLDGPFVVPVVSTMTEESLNCSGTLNSAQFFSYVPATYRIQVRIVTDPYEAQIPVNVTDYVPPSGHEDFAIVAQSNVFGSTGCGGAVALELGKTFAFRLAGISVDTRASCDISNPASAVATGGAWFQVIGNDTNYTATTCGEFLDTYNLESQIIVYSGNDCQNLMCVAFIDYGSENRLCLDGVSWLAESGVQYWIQVLVFSDGGSFPLTVFPTPPNQDCEAAIMLEAGQAAVKGTTLGALAGPNDSFCGNFDDSSEGVTAVWYSITGTDEDLTVFTCINSSFDNQILVYNGTCGRLTCIDGNNANGYNYLLICSGGFEVDTVVSWFAKAGMVYHIKVSAYHSSSTFELKVQVGKPPIGPNEYPTPPPEPPPENDNCEDAKWVSHELIVGSTFYATPSDFLSAELSVCNGESLLGNHLLPDVWYQFNGTGEWHTATTCTGFDALDSFDSYVVIYSGTCSSLTCIASNDNAFSSNCSWHNAIESWLTEEGETYLIRVSGWDEYGAGDFGIRIDDGKIESFPEPVNNHCENATLLELDQVVNGTILGASPSREVPWCDQGTYFPQDNPDVWYHLLGTGDVLTVTTCTNISLGDLLVETNLALYTGNCTSRMTCIDKKDLDYRKWCNDYYLSSVSWQSELNEEYYVRVSGYSFDTFGIMTYRGAPVFPDPDSTMPPY